MKAIGWLLIFIGIGAGIDAYHGDSPYKTLVSYLQGTGAVPTGGSVPAAPGTAAAAQAVTNATTAPQFGVSTIAQDQYGVTPIS